MIIYIFALFFLALGYGFLWLKHKSVEDDVNTYLSVPAAKRTVAHVGPLALAADPAILPVTQDAPVNPASQQLELYLAVLPGPGTFPSL